MVDCKEKTVRLRNLFLWKTNFILKLKSFHVVAMPQIKSDLLGVIHREWPSKLSHLYYKRKGVYNQSRKLSPTPNFIDDQQEMYASTFLGKW